MKKVTKHKIKKTKHYLVQYGSVECCHVCGVETYLYPTDDNDESPDGYFKVSVSGKYSISYPHDILHKGWMYHLCSDNCVSMFSMGLIDYED